LPKRNRLYRRDQWLAVAVTVILVSYFLPWLPHPAAGLRLIGLEMGEWVKFLPQVQFGQLSPSRNTFYLPPITAALLLSLMTWHWPNGRWQTWAARALAILIALLAFPAIEALRFDPPETYQQRLWGIGLVAAAAVAVAWGKRLPDWVQVSLLVLVGCAGAVWPLWAYAAARPMIVEWLGTAVAIGIGVWGNFMGHGLAAITAVMARPYPNSS
jgi:hypothetical protein